MTDPTNITELIRELMKRYGNEKHEEIFCNTICNRFPTIASHILAQEERLQVAVDALKLIRDGSVLSFTKRDLATMADKALSTIHLPKQI